MLTKEESRMFHGIAILAMIALHLFCRVDDFPYNVHIMDHNCVPILYYFGLFGDICVPIYCFTSGYAQQLLSDSEGEGYRINRWKRLRKFLCHFWLILCLFCVIGLIVHNDEMPGSFSKFMGNAFLYNLSYNGSWWFVLTYCFLVATAPLVVALVNRTNPWIVLVSGAGVYVVSYMLYFQCDISFGTTVVDWCLHQVLLFGRSVFPFIVGVLFFKYNLFGRLNESMSGHSRIRRCGIVIVPILLFLLHMKVQSLIIAPITAVCCMCCFCLWNKPGCVKSIFAFLGKHSTNIWLTHMFFYARLFEGAVFTLREPIFIYLFWLTLCFRYSVVHNQLYGKTTYRESGFL